MTQEPEQEPHPFHGPDEPTQEELEAWLTREWQLGTLNVESARMRGNAIAVTFEHHGTSPLKSSLSL